MESAYPLAYAKNAAEFESLLNFLKEKNLIKYNLSGISGQSFQITASLLADGWTRVNNSTASNKESSQGFIAIWFDEKMEESIAAIEAGIQASGFEPICIKDKYFPERIMDKALAEIRKSRFIVVDLTESRNSVFFEAGFAYGLGIEAIYVYKKDSKGSSPLDFYVKHYQCYEYSDPADLKEIIKNAVSARIKKGPKIDIDA
jgi:hypothetical protein